MSEIDFDELDRAVNDLMSNVDTSKRHEGFDDPEDKVVTLDSSSTESDRVTSPAPQESNAVPTSASTPTPTPVPIPAPTQPSSLAVKRRGQFMDMVHPSSDMRTASRPVKRDGVSIAPPSETTSTSSSTTSIVQPSPDNSVPANGQAVSTPLSVDTYSSSMAASKPASTPKPSNLSASNPTTTAFGADKSSQPSVSPVAKSIQPGPGTSPTPVSSSSELIETKNKDDQQLEALVSADPEIPAEIVDEASSISSPQPLPTAPFLSDARVEKRPLGANSEPAVTAAPSQDDVDEAAEPASEPVSLPAELQGDVVAVEASTPLDIDNPVSSTEVDDRSPEADLVVDADMDLTAQNIEQEEVDDQVNGSIYDTANYHQPIDGKKPEKKSSPLKWLAWFILLLIVGVGAGVAYFFLTH